MSIWPRRITLDPDTGAIYIYLRVFNRKGSVKRTVASSSLNLDYNKRGKLVGIEILT